MFFQLSCHAYKIISLSRRVGFIELIGFRRPAIERLRAVSLVKEGLLFASFAKHIWFACTVRSRMHLIAVCAFLFASIKYHLEKKLSWKKSCELSFFEESSQVSLLFFRHQSHLLCKPLTKLCGHRLLLDHFQHRAEGEDADQNLRLVPLAVV